MRGVFTEFSREPGGAVPLRLTAWRSTAPLEGPEPDAKVETLWTERVLHVCLDSIKAKTNQDSGPPFAFRDSALPHAGTARTPSDLTS